MTARRIREWPRLVAATVAVAVALVLIGIVVASASSSGGSRAPQRVTVTADSGASVHTAQLKAQVSAQAATITGLRASLARAHAQLAATRRALRSRSSRQGTITTRKTQSSKRHPARR